MFAAYPKKQWPSLNPVFQECLTNTKHLNIARREAETSEKDLLRVAQLCNQRNTRETRELGRESAKVSPEMFRN